jgi:hypothetical protein
MLVAICTDCIDIHKSTYHTIMTTMTPKIKYIMQIHLIHIFIS